MNGKRVTGHPIEYDYHAGYSFTDPNTNESVTFGAVPYPLEYLLRDAVGTDGEFIGNFGGGWGYEEPYAQVCDPILETPANSDLCEEFEFFHAMAAAMKLDLSVKSKAILDSKKAEQHRTVFPAGGPQPDQTGDEALPGRSLTIRAAFPFTSIHLRWKR